MYMAMEHVTPNWEPACASLDGADHAVTALVHRAPGALVVLILVNVAMELGAIMRQVNVCVYQAGQEQTVLGHVLQEPLAITAFRLVIVAIMHLAEGVMVFVNASQGGWDLDAHRLVLKVPLVANASMFVTVAQKTPFVILSKAVSAGMDLKETCVTSPSPAQSSRTKTLSCLVSQHLTMLDSSWGLSP